MIEPLIVDSFAGGGGASTGIEMALARSPDIAINHSAAALALHEVNHPDTLHLSENIYKVDPLDYVAGKHVGLAWFSPDCKHFSKAKGGKPVERNIRDLAWVVVLWAERAKPDVIILENVEEFRDWGPLVETERGLMPCPISKGHTFEKWCKALRKLGYKLQWRELRACDYGAPTIRKRFFLIARRDGKPITWPVPTHGKPTDKDVVSGKKSPWRTAAEIIDWSQPCPSIFDTSAEIHQKHNIRAIRPLATNTLARIARGMQRFVLDAQRPFLVNLTHGGRIEVADQPLNTITGANRGEKAVICPIMTAAQHGGSLRSIAEPVHTITASRKDQNSVIVPSLIQMGYGERQSQAPRVLDRSKPIGTVTAGGGKFGIATAFISRQFGTSTGHELERPAATIMPEGQGKSALVTAFMAQHNTMPNGATHAGRALSEPLSTITAKGTQQNLVAPYLMKFYGTGEGTTMQEPCHTITTKDRFADVECDLNAQPLSAGQIKRAKEVADFLRQHGAWDEREIVTISIDGELYTIIDIGMRMLTPRELFNAQGFPPSYRLDLDISGKPISKTTLVSCCGNSVSPVVAEALVAANCRHLFHLRAAAE